MSANIEKMPREAFAAWNAHDIEGFLSGCTDDTVYQAGAGARVVRGKAEMRSYLSEVFSAFPDFKIDLRLAFGDEQFIDTDWAMSGTFKGVLQPLGLQPTGKSFSVRGASMAELRNGKIRRHADYYDGVAFLRPTGVIP